MLHGIFPGQGELARRMRALDWSATGLGAPEGWPPNLRATVSLCLAAQTPMAICWGPAAVVLYNDAYAVLLGPGEHPVALGRPARECWAEHWHTIGPALDAVRATATAATTAVRMPGPDAPVGYALSPILAGDGATVDGVLCVCSVGQAAAQAVASLADGEERFVRFMRHLPGLAWIKDADGRYVFVNDTAEKVFGRPREQLYGRTDDEIFPPEIAAQFRTHDRQALASGRGVEVVESLWHDDGLLHHSIVSKFPIPGAPGRPPLVAGVAIDFTDRKRAEEALQEADRRKDEFLATLAHELRNPLAALGNGLQLVKLAAGDPGTLDRARELMERQVRQLVRLIDDLLDLGRITQGKITLRKERLSLAGVVQHAVDASRPAIEQRGQVLTTRLPAEPVFVDADPMRLAQVLANLLDNAAKFTAPGGRVTVAVERQRDEATVSVRDDGVGVPPDMLPRIFDMFTQVDRSLERSHAGLGIGLSLVKGLVGMHGGSVEARSEGAGRGTELIVRLPAVASASDRPASPAPAASPRVAGRRILVVDDNRDAAVSLAMMLSLAGNDARTAYDGLEALAIAAEFQPDVILLDIGMPNMNGYDAARRLRAQAGGRHALLVALTGWGQDDDRRRSAEAGFDHHLVKPVEPDALVALLGRVDPATA